MLDYPEVHCGQCMENLKVDGLEPQCDECKLREITPPNRSALEVYDIACPWGELDFKAAELALLARGVRRAEWRKHLRNLVTIHRLVRKHYAPPER